MTDDPTKVKLPDGTVVKATPERDAGADLERDVSRFGEPLVFDAEGNLVSGKPKPPPS